MDLTSTAAKVTKLLSARAKATKKAAKAKGAKNPPKTAVKAPTTVCAPMHPSSCVPAMVPTTSGTRGAVERGQVGEANGALVASSGRQVAHAATPGLAAAINELAQPLRADLRADALSTVPPLPIPVGASEGATIVQEAACRPQLPTKPAPYRSPLSALLSRKNSANSAPEGSGKTRCATSARPVRLLLGNGLESKVSSCNSTARYDAEHTDS